MLIEDLLSASGVHAASDAAAAIAAADFADADDDDDGEGGWEDDLGETLDLSLPGTKAELLGWADSTSSRQKDDETQVYLTEFFIRAASENIAGFQEYFAMLTDDEKAKLQNLAQQQAHQ